MKALYVVFASMIEKVSNILYPNLVFNLIEPERVLFILIESLNDKAIGPQLRRFNP